MTLLSDNSIYDGLIRIKKIYDVIFESLSAVFLEEFLGIYYHLSLVDSGFSRL